MQVVERCFIDIDLVFLGKRCRRQRVLEELGDAHRNVVAREAREVLSRVGLGIEVDQQRPIAFVSADCSQIAGDARFADTALLIEYHATHALVPLKDEETAGAADKDLRIGRV
ncbi:hypothetical protein ALP29_200523 [Pseudomonas syringae pv. avii]|uniref:Uncharacterized protein n=1 Tax=Pseudomonas syringae pv. avii TaxID=663959 RepID=A0A3M5VC04_PSESX|nr:hypothetical protein ALP29_200523 [Pseudomonas syringae pv. avii]